MNKLNGISIVIATKGRVKLLEDLLESVLVARNNFKGDSEVILIDDSNEADVKEIEIMCQQYDAKRIYFSPSVAEKRNVGARNAKYDIVLFLDSDCLATPNLLNEHYNTYKDEKIGAVAGLLEFTGEDTWFWKAVEKSPFVICFGFAKWMDTVPWTPTANCSVRREVFEEVGGFDRSFPDKPGGEDVDLGLRIIKKGYIFKCAKDALVYHSKKTWIPVKAMFKRLWYYGSANYYLAERHPDYTMKIMPRKSLIYAVGIFLTALMSAIKLNALLLLLIPLWIVADIALSSIFVNACAKYKRVSFLHQCVIQLLILDNELGFVWRCLRKKKPKYILKDVVYFDGQMDGLLDNGAISVWENLVSLALLFFSLFII